MGYHKILIYCLMRDNSLEGGAMQDEMSFSTLLSTPLCHKANQQLA